MWLGCLQVVVICNYSSTSIYVSMRYYLQEIYNLGITFTHQVHSPNAPELFEPQNHKITMIRVCKLFIIMKTSKY